MPKFFSRSALLASSVMVLGLVPVSDASAQKKLSYSQAMASCKKEISANVPMLDATTSAARYTAGSACMKKYGYRLKKKTSF
jgi:hypothetical protein